MTHFTRAGMAVLIIEDLVSRKWITEIVSVEETSTQVEMAFTAALEAEGCSPLSRPAQPRASRPDRRRRVPPDPARRLRQRTPDDVGINPSIPSPRHGMGLL